MKWFNRWRVAALIVVILGTALMMWLGKQHTLIIENTPCVIGEVELEPFDTVIVKISDKDELEIYEDESDYFEPAGPFYTLEIEIPGERGAPSRFLTKKMYLGFADRVTINVPKLAHEEGGD